MRRKRQNRVKRIFESPWFRVAEVLLVLVSIFLAVFFGLRSKAERELVYAVNPMRTNVVTAGQASDLAVLYKGEPLGNVDVTTAQVAIWNAGKQSIREENILEDVVIFTNPPVLILEASIRQRSREVTGFTIADTPDSLASGRVPILWRILEEGDGASVQLIYVGTPAVDFRVEGVIEGLYDIKHVELGVKITTPQEQIRKQQSSQLLFGIIALGTGLVIVSASLVAFIRREWRELLVLAIGFLPMFGISIWQYFSVSTRFWPPFGF